MLMSKIVIKKRNFRIDLIIISLFLSWYLLPIINYNFKGGIYNIIMVSLLIIWFISCLIKFKNNKKNLPRFIIYLFLITMFYALNMIIRPNVGNIPEFIKMGLIFWFPIFIFLFYYLLNDSTAIKYIFKLCIVLMIITLVPTLIEVIKNPQSIRRMAYGGIDTIDDIEKISKNVGGFQFFYGTVFFIPILFDMFIKDNKSKFKYIIILAALLFLIIRGSFLIALVITCIELMIYFLKNNKKTSIKMIIIYLIVILLLLIILFPGILLNLSNSISNESFKDRIYQIYLYLINGEISGDFGDRLKLYYLSIATFLKHPFFGIGGYYYISNVNLGYHSQLFDDAARYGIFYICTLFLLLTNIIKYIKLNFCKVNSDIALLISEFVGYFIFMTLNPTYESTWTSIALFLFLPSYLFLKGGKKIDD